MSSFERKIVRWIVRHRAAVLIAVATCLGALIRFSLRDVISKDMRMYLLPWFSQIRDNGGLRGLDVQVGNYNVAYQFIIALLTYLPLRPELLYKLVSVAFDFVLALGAGKLLYDVYGGKERFALAYSVTLLLPTVFLNSAAWGQCDSIYASLCVFCLDLLYLNFKEPKLRRAVLAFVALGFAFAMKLQTVFILPFVVYLFFQNGGGSAYCTA